jgi:diguanylate cyclase (GGDEF)-like protein
MPRLTGKVFIDLAIWMIAFGLVIGVVFPPFCVALGLPAERILTPIFFASTLSAGLVVGAANYALARLVVGRRLRRLATSMETVETQLAGAMLTHDWSGCEPERCALPVDSADEVGASAAAFNRLIRTLSRSHQVDAATRNFTEVISSHLDLDELADASLDALLLHTGAAAGAILVIREDTLVPEASHGLRALDRLADNDHVRRALRQGRTERILVDPDGAIVDSLLVDQVAREILAIPVLFKRVPLGVVILASVAPFAADVEALVEQLRADLGLALNNALTHDRLQRLAAMDPLTEAYNRRFGLSRLQEEFARSVRSGGPLGVLMLDLDHFKAVNDTYGHLVGDRVLRAAAAACRRIIREGDVLIRFGGEEFLILLPGAALADLGELGERIRRAIGATVVSDGDQRIGVTVSVGAASFPEEGVESPEALVELADAALYAAKAAGRDRVQLAA